MGRFDFHKPRFETCAPAASIEQCKSFGDLADCNHTEIDIFHGEASKCVSHTRIPLWSLYFRDDAGIDQRSYHSNSRDGVRFRLKSTPVKSGPLRIISFKDRFGMHIRLYSAIETSTATGSPRRRTVCGPSDSARFTISLNLFFASANCHSAISSPNRFFCFRTLPVHDFTHFYLARLSSYIASIAGVFWAEKDNHRGLSLPVLGRQGCKRESGFPATRGSSTSSV